MGGGGGRRRWAEAVGGGGGRRRWAENDARPSAEKENCISMYRPAFLQLPLLGLAIIPLISLGQLGKSLSCPQP